MTRADANASNPFVELDWFARHASDANVRIVDTRSKPHGSPDPNAPTGAQQYASGHVSGAVHLDYADHLADPATPYAMRVAPAERLAEVFGAAGIGDDTLVVAYDDGDVPYAARLVWTLRYLGHDRAAILAGGFPAWKAAGGEPTRDVPRFALATFTPHVRERLRASRDEVLASTREGSGAQLLETQRNKTYALRDRDIAGSVRLSANDLLEDARGGRIAPAATLARLIDDRNLDRAARTIVTCGSGVSASGAYIALLEAGFTDVAVYDGSWLEWDHDGLPTRPKVESA